jgi:hypothetical protein
MAVSAVMNSGIATPLHGNILLNVPHHREIEASGRSRERILNHRNRERLSQDNPISHIANGNVMKKPRDAM